jgi:hypothetical protein
VAQAVIKNAARHHFMDFCSTLGRLSSSSKPIKNAPKCIILNVNVNVNVTFIYGAVFSPVRRIQRRRTV